MAGNPCNIIPDQEIVLEGGAKLVPAPEAVDSGKVLGVLNSNGDIGWTEDREGMAQQQADWAETDPSKVTFIANKPTIPSKTSDLQNDSGFITSSSLPTVDQTYNASSSNAQSGVAVASAIAGVNAVPASASTDSGKVLKVDAQGAPVWSDAGGAFEIIEWSSATYNLVKAAYDSGKQPVILDKTSINSQPLYGYLVSREMDPYFPTRINTFRFLSIKSIGAYFISDQSATAVEYVVPNSGFKTSSEVKVSAKFTTDSSVTLMQDGVGQIKISVANPLPASTSADADKVLTVNSSGTPVWATAQGGGGGGGIPALPSIDEAHHSYILTAHKHTLPGNVQVVTADWVAPSFTYFYPAAYSDGSGYQLSDWEYYQTLGQSIQSALLTAFENFDPWYYGTPYEIQARLGVNTSADISLRLPLDCSTSRSLSIQTDLEIGGSMDGMSTDITLYKMRGTGFIGNNNDAPVFLSTIHLPIVTDAPYQDITNTYFSITPESGYNVSVPSADSYDPDVLKHFGIYITLYPNGQMSSRNIV